jgi:hypothetical protein
MSLRQHPSTVRHRPSSTPLAALRRADPHVRTVVIRVRAWALARGEACSTDALTAVVGSAVDEGRAGLSSPLRWTRKRVDKVLRNGAPSYCTRREVDLPEGLGRAMELFLEYLGAQDALAPESEPLDRLLVAARSAIDPVDRRRIVAARHPANGRGA